MSKGRGSLLNVRVVDKLLHKIKIYIGGIAMIKLQIDKRKECGYYDEVFKNNCSLMLFIDECPNYRAE